jgi:hypothetical protein
MKMSKFLASSLLMFFFVFPVVHSQENPDTSYWKLGGLGSINLSQVSLTNWAAGGENSFSANILANGLANYNKGKSSWENMLILGYGLMKQGETGVRKTDDRLDFSSKYGRQAVEHWYYTAMLRFYTQFTDGFNYPNDSVPISRFMAPGYINLSIGMDYKPSENFNVYIGPLSGKVTYVLDDTLSHYGAFGVEQDKNVRYEFGGLIKSMYTREIVKNVIFLTRLDLFSNYLKHPEKIDVNWEVLLNMKINKYLSASINTLLIWDDDIKFDMFDSEGVPTGEKKSKVQFKEVFGIGLSATF